MSSVGPFLFSAAMTTVTIRISDLFFDIHCFKLSTIFQSNLKSNLRTVCGLGARFSHKMESE